MERDGQEDAEYHGFVIQDNGPGKLLPTCSDSC